MTTSGLRSRPGGAPGADRGLGRARCGRLAGEVLRRVVEAARLRVELLRIRRGRRDHDRGDALAAHHAGRQVEARALLRLQVLVVSAAGVRGSTAREDEQRKRGQEQPQRGWTHQCYRGTMQEARIVQPPARGCGTPLPRPPGPIRAGHPASAATAAWSPSGTRRSGWPGTRICRPPRRPAGPAPTAPWPSGGPSSGMVLTLPLCR